MNKASVEVAKSKELLDLLDGHRDRPIQNGVEFLGVDLNAIFRDNVT